MMSHLTRRQPFSEAGEVILPQPNPLSPQERNQKVFNDYVGRMKKYLADGVGMPEWFVKDLIFEKAEELGINLKAHGGRVNFSKAGLADPANNIKVGQELGDGIKQKTFTDAKGVKKSGGYEVTVGGKTGKKKQLIGFNSNYTQAKKLRADLLMKYGELGTGGKSTLTWEKFSKEKGFVEYMDEAIKNNKNLQQSMKNAGLTDKSPKEKIFNTFKKMVADHNALGKRAIDVPSSQKLSKHAFHNFLNTFNKTFKPNLGLMNFDQFAKDLPISRHKIKDFIYDAQKIMPTAGEATTLKGRHKGSRIERALMFKKALKDAGITLERVSGSWKFNATASQINHLKNNFDFHEKKGTVGIKPDEASKASKKTTEWKTKKYSRDLTNIERLVRNMNNQVKFLTNDFTEFSKLRKWIAANPKLLSMVEATFNQVTGKMDKVPLHKIPDDALRSKIRFEADHIKGREHVKWDKASKRILSGIGIEFPKNMYILPGNINNSAKRAVESWVASHPKEKTKIKNLETWFRNRDISYFDKTKNKIVGATPKNISTDVKRLGIDLKAFLTSKVINQKTGLPVIEGGEKLLKNITARHQFLLNSGVPVDDIVRMVSSDLKVPIKAVGNVLGKVLKVAGPASFALDVVPFAQARDLGIDNWGAVGGKNLGEAYVNMPGMIWEGGRWIKSKLQGKEHEWKLPYEAQFGQRATAKALRESSVEDLINNIKAQAEDAKKMHAGQQIDTTWSDEKLHDRITKTLELKKYYDSNPDVLAEKETVVKDTDNVFGTTVPTKELTYGPNYVDQIKDLKV